MVRVRAGVTYMAGGADCALASAAKKIRAVEANRAIYLFLTLAPNICHHLVEGGDGAGIAAKLDLHLECQVSILAAERTCERGNIVCL